VKTIGIGLSVKSTIGLALVLMQLFLINVVLYHKRTKTWEVTSPLSRKVLFYTLYEVLKTGVYCRRGFNQAISNGGGFDWWGS